jgi:hypothetical protein
MVQPPTATGSSQSTPVPVGTRATGFDEKRVILTRQGSGTDHWSAGQASYQPAFEEKLLAVYGAKGQAPVGLVQEDAKTCLVEISPKTKGWQTGTRLGCADLLSNAAHAGNGLNRATRSPDGRWLAVPSPTGVHLIDIFTTRVSTDLVFGYSCLSSPNAPAVWSDSSTVLTLTSSNGVVACQSNGARYAVALPAGISDGWALVRRYGVTG